MHPKAPPRYRRIACRRRIAQRHPVIRSPRVTLVSRPACPSFPPGPVLLPSWAEPYTPPSLTVAPLFSYPTLTRTLAFYYHEDGPNTSGRSRYHLPCTSAAGRCFQGRNSLSCRGLYARPLGRGEFHRANFSALLANNSSLVHSGTRGSPIRSRASITRREGRSSSSTRTNASGVFSASRLRGVPLLFDSPAFSSSLRGREITIRGTSSIGQPVSSGSLCADIRS